MEMKIKHIVSVLVALLVCVGSAVAETTNQVYKITCPECTNTCYALPQRVDRTYRNDPDPNHRIIQTTLWFRCPACLNEFSVYKERRPPEARAIEVPPAPPLPGVVPVLPNPDPVSFVNIPPGW